MRHQILLLTVFLTVLPLSTVPVIGGKSLAGAWEPIKDVHDDPQVQFIAHVAVNFYNLKHHSNLILKDVVRGETQTSGAATKYLLHIIVDQLSSPCYKTMVLDKKKSPHYRELLLFEREIC
ncbi:uncharacterized protein LOC115733688 [Rhodamnia argentea]|uniref:Uncharacterized protein LOC115733688 n=1 Tax=Rhodamnia argentea TaxID=178133 RepID=A0A8B8ND03_9MYRT|nr:uncharacterized protein LOC115733688 [Rhodamnia argentea]